MTVVTSSSEGALGHSQSCAAFAFEKQATSLNDLEIIRKIVEREGCLEALEQLLTSKHKKSQALSPNAKAVATPAPMVVQGLIDQLRTVSLYIVEAVEKWKASNQMNVFQWRKLNYFVKMTHDLDFLAERAVYVDALRTVRLQRNPFLSPIHLDHAALRESSPVVALALGEWVGNVSMKRVFFASQALLRELEADSQRQGLMTAHNSSSSLGASDSMGNPEQSLALVVPSAISASVLKQHSIMASATPTKVHWSHQSVKIPGMTVKSAGPTSKLICTPPEDPLEAMQQDISLSKELILHAEHEVGALREDLAVLQEKLNDTTLPEKRRKLQNKIGTLTNEMKFKSGDVYMRKNELRRKESVFRLACDRSRGNKHSGPIAFSVRSHDESIDQNCEPKHQPSDALDAVLQEDELHRQAIVEKFAALARMKAKPKQQQLKSSHPSTSKLSAQAARQYCSPQVVSLHQMSPDQVQTFIDSLELGSSVGALFKNRGIDGVLLGQANENDLEELGVSIRLHRVRILEAIGGIRQHASQL